jgi:hypothetical protein
MSTDVRESPNWSRHCDKLRYELEWRIVEMAITDLLYHDYALHFDHDALDEPYKILIADQETMNELFACDQETVIARKDGHSTYVTFIYGNSGYDTIADYGVSLEKPLKRVLDFAAQYA